MGGRDPAPPLRGALPAGFALWALALGLTAWGPGEPRDPVFAGEVAVSLVDEAGLALSGNVAIRCWHVDRDPPFTEADGPSAPERPFVFHAPACFALQLAAVSPDHAPATLRRGVPVGALTVTLPSLPEGPPAELRDVGWGGRTTPGAVLEASRQADGSVRVVGWDVERERPAEAFAQADLWLAPSAAGDDLHLMRLAPGGRASQNLSAWVKLPEAQGTPFPWGAARWPQDAALADRRQRGGVGLVGRDGRQYAFAETGSAGEGPGCGESLDDCLRWTWTYAVLVMGRGQAATRIPPPRRARSLLPAVDATRDALHEPWAVIAAREAE
jgi:hypothetical protein